MRNLNNLDLQLLYDRAKASLTECLNHDTESFASEAPFPLCQMQSKPDFVRVTFHGGDNKEYLFETKLILLSPSGDSFGYYCLHEDENGEVVDDFLVFE